MKILDRSSKDEVLNHWKEIDRYKECPHVASWRNSIWSPLPSDIVWYHAEIEEVDLERIFIISSDEWSHLSRSFRLIDVAAGIDEKADGDIVGEILDLMAKLRKESSSVDRKLTLVSPFPEGNHTVIDGNKRAVALYKTGELMGNSVYLGVSTKIVDYSWAKRAMSYESRRALK